MLILLIKWGASQVPCFLCSNQSIWVTHHKKKTNFFWRLEASQNIGFCATTNIFLFGPTIEVKRWEFWAIWDKIKDCALARNGKYVYFKWKILLTLDNHNFYVINKIKWFKSLLKRPKMKYKLPLDYITNIVSNMTSFFFNTLNVHSWACLS